MSEMGLVRRIDIDHEMQQAYLDYAMSVIVARALPDARDGLKPVHRRILYAMHDLGLQANSAYKKSARIVGEVLGKYHPHSDAAVYESMVRMAQDFSMRHPLVDGQGNFGSMDGDSAAAMRYTEARLAFLAGDLLADIDKDTVNFSDTFDGSLTEPDVLPASFPNLLVNGASGIAVGMATNIPPHNLGEVIEACKLLLDRWEKMDDLSVEELMSFIKGPDFPTGGLILQEADGESLAQAYGSGRGKVTVQARAHFEEMERGRSRIIVTELPYQVNKSALVERIAGLVRDEKLEGITDLRDESDRQGMRIVIELSKSAEPEQVLRDLYRNTPMQTTFGIILLALVGGEPRMLALKQALRVYLEHRLEVVRRRSEFDLAKAQRRAHILEGLRTALANLDEVIDLIRKSPDAPTARERLIKRFKLSEIQADAILEMPLRRLAALERKKIDQEYAEVKALIKQLETLLASPKKMRLAVAEELNRIQEKYADRRRTQIISVKPGESLKAILTAGDYLTESAVWIGVTGDGLTGALHEGVDPLGLSGPAPELLSQMRNTDHLLVIGEQGSGATLAAHTAPQVNSLTQGVPVNRLSALPEGESPAAMLGLPVRNGVDSGWSVITVSAEALIKRTALDDIPGPSARAFAISKVSGTDRIVWAGLTQTGDDMLLFTRRGMAIRFSLDDVRPIGLGAAGVYGIKLAAGDSVVGAQTIPAKAKGDLMLIAGHGRGKRLSYTELPRQGRYGQGVVAWKLTKEQHIAGVVSPTNLGRVYLQDMLGVWTAQPWEKAPRQARAGQGVPMLGRQQCANVLTAWQAPWIEEGAGATSTASGANGPDAGSVPTAGAGAKKAAAAKSAKTPTARTAKTKATAAKASTPAKPAAAKSGKATASTSASAKATRTAKSEPAAEKPAGKSKRSAPSQAALPGLSDPPAKPATRKRSTSSTPAEDKPSKPAASTPTSTRAAKPAAASAESKSGTSRTKASGTKPAAGKTPAKKPTSTAASEKKPATRKPAAGKPASTGSRKTSETVGPTKLTPVDTKRGKKK